MRTLTKILIAAGSSILMLSCTKTLNEDITGELRSGAFGMDKTHETKMATISFSAHFYTKRNYSKEE